MKIETTEDVLNEIADRFMIYGTCKSEDTDGCDSESHFCCRVGFTAHYQERFDNAYVNEQKLNKAGII